MELSAEAKAIISQASQWTFAGDCSLLQWMQSISQNLEQRVTTTDNSLQDLNTNVNRANIHCSNVANSLAALQHTQFVESRVHDDDETIANIAEVPVLNANDQPKSNKEILKIFLQKNLDMLHNCHERYALDFEDSDEDEAVNNYIYQPKNPYNDRLLPHIYGSKLWKENWHVGLCDGENDYSGDEISEAFSESSTSASGADNESYESNTGNLSQSTSSISILNEKYPTNIEIQNASSLHGSQSFPFPDDRNVPGGGGGVQIDANSDSSSTTSRSAAIAATKNLQRRINDKYDLFASLQDTPSTSIASSISTPQQQRRKQHQVPTGRSTINTNKYKPMPFLDQMPPDDIFIEHSIPATSAATTTVDTQQSVDKMPAKMQIKRKPVNLFDDNDFNSFMTEIVDKAQQTKGNAPTTLPTPAARKLGTNVVAPSLIPTLQEKQPVNLFDNSPIEDSKAPPQTSVPVEIEKPREKTKKNTVNLFESPEISPINESIFAHIKPIEYSSKPDVIVGKTRITAKSLFDDDDDDGDDDFLNVFGAKKMPNISKITQKTSLFDDNDMLEDAQNTDVGTNTKTTLKKEDEIVIEKVEQSTEKTLPFDDRDKKKQTEKTDTNNSEKILDEEKSNTKPVVKKKINLFADDDEENENDLFGTSKAQKRNPDIFASKDIDILKDSGNGKFGSKDDEQSIEEKAKSKKLVDEVSEKTTITATTDTKGKKTNLFATSLFSDQTDDDFFNETDKFTSSDIDNINIVNNEEETISSKIQHNEVVRDIEESIQHQMISSSIDANTSSTKELPLEDAAKEDLKENQTDVVNERSYKINNNVEPKVTGLSETNTEITTDPKIQQYNATISIDQIDENSTPIKISTPTKSKTITEVDVTKESITTAPSSSHNYAGIFLDEPPDDDDFFETLGSNRLSTSKLDEPPDDDDFFETLGSNRLSTSNLAIDLENDFYEEPALPQAPPAAPASSTTTIQNQETNKPTDTNNYSGLRLFSEIPPDDDNNDNAATITRKTSIDGGTKRLHSVFYDDFSETLEAVRKSNENKESMHALFEDEPPPDDDCSNFDIFAKVTKKSTVGKPALTKDEMDHSVQLTNSNVEIATNIPDTVAKLKQDFEHPPLPLVSDKEKVCEGGAISKLQMPKININVQALLPGGSFPSRKTNLNKSLEVAEIEVGHVPTSVAIISQPATESNENILNNICKNRVRIPVKRRPSTRRGRQESYRKSLIAEQDNDFETFASSNEKSTLEDITTISICEEKNVLEDKIQNEKVQQNKIIFNNDVVQSKTKPIPSNAENKVIPNVGVLEQRKSKLILPDLFADNNDNEDDFIFSTNKSKPIHTKPDESSLAASSSKSSTTVSGAKFEDNLAEKPTVPMPMSNVIAAATSTKIVNKTGTKIFADSDDDVDDLFDSISPRKNTTIAVRVEKQQTKLFADEQTDESDEDLFKSIATNKTKIVPQQKIGRKKLDPLFGSDNEDDAEFLSALKKHEKLKAAATNKINQQQQHKKVATSLFSDADDDDDDLFGGGGAKAKSTSAKIITKTDTPNMSNDQHPSTIMVPKTNTSKTLKDNPLADLLNS